MISNHREAITMIAVKCKVSYKYCITEEKVLELYKNSAKILNQTWILLTGNRKEGKNLQYI